MRVDPDGHLRIRDEAVGTGKICRRILTALPTWFGIQASVEDYVAAADRSPTIIASLGDENVGFLTLVRHSHYAAEVYVMAMVPELHHADVSLRLVVLVMPISA